MHCRHRTPVALASRFDTFKRYMKVLHRASFTVEILGEGTPCAETKVIASD